MRGFLDAVEDVRHGGLHPLYHEHFDLVLNGLSGLKTVHSKAQLDVNNIESVFAAFEMASLLKRPLGDLQLADVNQLALAMRTVIARTLVERVPIPLQTSESPPGPVPPKGYSNLGEAISSGGEFEGASIITFNYDLALDFTAYYHDLPVDYALQPAPLWGSDSKHCWDRRLSRGLSLSTSFSRTTSGNTPLGSEHFRFRGESWFNRAQRGHSF